MKATIERDVFYRMLHKAFQSRKRKASLPMGNNVKLFVAGAKESGVLHIRTYDGDTFFKSYISAEDVIEGQAVVDCQILLNIIKVAKDSISLSVIEKDNTTFLEVKSDGCTYLLYSLSDNEDFFRDHDIGDYVATYRTDGKSLREMISRAFYASGESDTRYTLNGLLFAFSRGRLDIVGTDGHRMAVLKKDIANNTPTSINGKFIAHRRFLTALLQTVRLCSEPELIFTKTHTKLNCGNITLISRVIDGTYPNYEKVVPEKTLTKIVFKKEDAITAINKLMPILESGTYLKAYITKVSIDHDGLLLEARNSSMQYTASMLIPVEISESENLPLEIGFNLSYVKEALSQCNTLFVCWGFNDQLSPTLINGVMDAEDKAELKGEEYEAVVMPMRIPGVGGRVS